MIRANPERTTMQSPPASSHGAHLGPPFVFAEGRQVDWHEAGAVQHEDVAADRHRDAVASVDHAAELLEFKRTADVLDKRFAEKFAPDLRTGGSHPRRPPQSVDNCKECCCAHR